MVKKHKGGRRQILQLEDKKPSRGEWESTSTAALNKDICPLDSQVADFFKEIDALTVNEQPTEESAEVSIPEASAEAKNVEEEGARDSQPELQEAAVHDEVGTNQSVQLAEGIYCPWQEIRDATSGYNYYWNTQTNEVTWECPPEFQAYMKSRTSDSDKDIYEDSFKSQEVQKKSKKEKKKNLLEHANPEGSIIPISYFGGSSSDESGAETENRLSSVVNKSLKADLRENLKTDLNTPSSSKSKSFKKEDNDYKANCSEHAEVIGPQLPPNFQFPQSVPLEPEVSGLPNYSLSCKNEVEEFVEIGPQLPAAATNDSSSITEALVSGNVNPSQSHTNGLSVASSSLENSWQASSVKNTEITNKNVVREAGEESPDSTERKSDTFSENGVGGSADCQTNSSANPKHRLIVAYDTFTDEDEDAAFSNISSSKQILNSKNFMYQNFKLAENGSKREGVNDYGIDGDQQKVESNVSKRKISDEHMERNTKKAKDEKKDFLDIDSLFAAHASSGKYGFGFSKQKQLSLENGFGIVGNDATKVTSDCKAVNFVKSDHVFELNTLNENISSARSLGNSHADEEKQLISSGNCDVPPSERATQKLDHMLETNFSKEKDAVSEVKIVASDKKIGSPFPAELNIDLIRRKKDSLSQEGRNALSCSNILCGKLEPDIEEIDKALCDALEAKKAMTSENSLSKPSSASNLPTVKKSSEITSNLSMENKETDTYGLNSTNDPNMMMSIIDLSSVLADKLTFLLSSHSLASFSTILVQLQTRLIDWQAGALESKYFMCRLQEIDQYLHHYEMASLSGDWICQWSRESKRYFYVNNRTQHAQWAYPEELCNQEKTSWMTTSDMVATSSASSFGSEQRDDFQTVSSSVPERQLPESRPTSFAFDSRKERGGVCGQYSDSAVGWSSPPPPPPGVDTPPPPPPPQSPPPDSPPPPPPDSTEVGDLPEDMDLDSDDSGPLPFISQCNSDKDMQMQYPPFMALRSPERSPENIPSTSVSNAVSSTSLSFCDDLNVAMKSPQPVSNSHDCLDPVNMMWTMTHTQPSCSSGNYSFDKGNEAHVNELLLTSSTETKEYEMCASSSSGGSICPSDSFFYRKASPYSTALKKEKKKPNNLPGLALKKKNIPTLVQKWQKIKEEQEKEDENSDDTKNSNCV